jgi:hypothetical protein
MLKKAIDKLKLAFRPLHFGAQTYDVPLSVSHGMFSHRMHGNRLVAISIFLSVAIQCTAQISSSPYSVYGIGLFKDRTSSMNRAIGGTGYAIRDGLSLNNFNPASYTSIQQATQIMEFGIFLESDRYRNKRESTSSSTGNITNLNLWLRFHKRWAGSVGVNPFSSVHYNIAADNSTGDQYSGSGGVSEFYFGNAFQLTKNISVGVTASFLHGSVNRREIVTSGLAGGTEVSSITYVNKGKLDFGLQYMIPMGTDNSFTIGAVYNSRLSLDTREEMTIYHKQDTLASDKTNVDDYILPQKIGSGLAFQHKQSLVTFDITYQQWSKGKLEDDLKLRDTRRVSFGYQYRGTSAGSLWNGVVLRTGGYLQENPIVLQNTSFRDWGVSVGLGLPVSNGRNALNLTYSYNRSGTLEKNLINQQSHIFALDITFRDLWGIRRKFD